MSNSHCDDQTSEIAKLQVGPSPKPVKLVCSTVSEIEHLLPWLLECKAENRHINVRGPILQRQPINTNLACKVLYGLPLSPSQILRLGRIANQLGEGVLGIFVDHPAHIKALDQVGDDVWLGRVPVWVNIVRKSILPSSLQVPSLKASLYRLGRWVPS